MVRRLLLDHQISFNLSQCKMQSVTFVLGLIVLGVHALLVFGDCNIGGHILKDGETYTPIGECAEHTCIDNNAVSTVWCSVEVHQKPCKKVEEDLSKPYPLCCSYFEDC